MGKNYPLPLRLISSILILAFFCQELAYAAPEIKPASLFSQEKLTLGYSFPASVAEIEDSYRAPASSKTIFLLQDAHTNESGQLNLAETLDILLTREKGLEYVFTEAAVDDNSVGFLRTARSPEERNRLARLYIRKGLLHGDEYLQLTTDHAFKIWGVEKPELYVRALEAYKAVAHEREHLTGYLKKITATLETLKDRLMNPLLRESDRHSARFAGGETALTDHLELLIRRAESQNIPLSGYPHLSVLKTLKEKEAGIDFGKANEEQAAAVRALAAGDRAEVEAFARLSDKKASPLTSDGQDEERAFFALLEEKLTGRRKDYPELFEYFEYLKAARELRAGNVLEELSALEASVLKALTRTSDEGLLLRCGKQVSLLNKLFHFSLTPKEFSEYRELSSGFSIEHLTGFLNRKIMELDSYHERSLFLDSGYDEAVKRAEEFYRLTAERDTYFIGRMLEKMDAGFQTKAALLTGGFHTENLKSLLKEQGVSFVSITPQVFAETNLKRYETILFEQTAAPSALFVPALQSTLMTGRAPSFERGIPVSGEARSALAEFGLRRPEAPVTGARLSSGEENTRRILAEAGLDVEGGTYSLEEIRAKVDAHNVRVGGLLDLMERSGGALKEAVAVPIPLGEPTPEDEVYFLRRVYRGDRIVLDFGAGRATRLKLPRMFDDLGIVGLTAVLLKLIDRYRGDHPVAAPQALEQSGEIQDAVEKARSGKVDRLEDLSIAQRHLLQYRYKVEKMLARHPELGISREDLFSKMSFAFILNSQNIQTVGNQMAAIKFAGLDPSRIYAILQREVGGYEIIDGRLVWQDRIVFPEGHGSILHEMNLDPGIAFRFKKDGSLAPLGKTVLEAFRAEGIDRVLIVQANDLNLLSTVDSVTRWRLADTLIAQGQEMIVEMVDNSRLKQKGGFAAKKEAEGVFVRDSQALADPRLEQYRIPRQLGRMFTITTTDVLRNTTPDVFPSYIALRKDPETDTVRFLTLEQFSTDLSSEVRAVVMNERGKELHTFKEQFRIRPTLQEIARQDRQEGFGDLVSPLIHWTPSRESPPGPPLSMYTPLISFHANVSTEVIDKIAAEISRLVRQWPDIEVGPISVKSRTRMVLDGNRRALSEYIEKYFSSREIRFELTSSTLSEERLRERAVELVAIFAKYGSSQSGPWGARLSGADWIAGVSLILGPIALMVGMAMKLRLDKFSSGAKTGKEELRYVFLRPVFRFLRLEERVQTLDRAYAAFLVQRAAKMLQNRSGYQRDHSALQSIEKDLVSADVSVRNRALGDLRGILSAFAAEDRSETVLVVKGGASSIQSLLDRAIRIIDPSSPGARLALNDRLLRKLNLALSRAQRHQRPFIKVDIDPARHYSWNPLQEEPILAAEAVLRLLTEAEREGISNDPEAIRVSEDGAAVSIRVPALTVARQILQSREWNTRGGLYKVRGILPLFTDAVRVEFDVWSADPGTRRWRQEVTIFADPNDAASIQRGVENFLEPGTAFGARLSDRNKTFVRAFFTFLSFIFGSSLQGQTVNLAVDHAARRVRVVFNGDTLARSELAGAVYQPTEGTTHISYYTEGRMAELLAPLLPANDPVLAGLGLSRRGADHARILTQQLNIKNIRLYYLPLGVQNDIDAVKLILRRAHELYGLRVMAGHWAGLWQLSGSPSIVESNTPQSRQALIQSVVKQVQTYSKEPWLLYWDLGNETNYHVRGGPFTWRVFPMTKLDYYHFMADLAVNVKRTERALGTKHPVLLGHGGLTASEADMIARVNREKAAALGGEMPFDALAVTTYPGVNFTGRGAQGDFTRDDSFSGNVSGIDDIFRLAHQIGLPVVIAETGIWASGPQDLRQVRYYGALRPRFLTSEWWAAIFAFSATDEAWKPNESGQNRQTEGMFGVLGKAFHRQGGFGPWFGQAPVTNVPAAAGPAAPASQGTDLIALSTGRGQQPFPQYRSQAAWFDFGNVNSATLELKRGDVLVVEYSLTGGQDLGVNLRPRGQDPGDGSSLQTFTRAGGERKRVEIRVARDGRYWQMAFQYGPQAWGQLGNGTNTMSTRLVVHSIARRPSGARLPEVALKRLRLTGEFVGSESAVGAVSDELVAKVAGDKVIIFRQSVRGETPLSLTAEVRSWDAVTGPGEVLASNELPRTLFNAARTNAIQYQGTALIRVLAEALSSGRSAQKVLAFDPALIDWNALVYSGGKTGNGLWRASGGRLARDRAARKKSDNDTPVFPASNLRTIESIQQGIAWKKDNEYIFGGGFGYDIRMNDALRDVYRASQFAYALGRTFGGAQYLGNKGRALVTGDQRWTSDSLRMAFIQGLLDEGIDVVTQLDGEAITTGLTTRKGLAEDFDLVVQTTGSHNLPQANGFKMIYKSLPFFADKLLELSKAVESQIGWSDAVREGSLEKQELIEEHVDALNAVLPALNNGAPIIADFRNGSAAAVTVGLAAAKGYRIVRLGDIPKEPPKVFDLRETGVRVLPNRLYDLPEEVFGDGPVLITLNESPSGDMPGGIWDPSKTESFDNIIVIQEQIHGNPRNVHKKDYAGAVFDGDGDRSGLITGAMHTKPSGRLVQSERMLMAFYDQMVRDNMDGIRALNKLGHTVLLALDVRSSKNIIDVLKGLSSRNSLALKGVFIPAGFPNHRAFVLNELISIEALLKARGQELSEAERDAVTRLMLQYTSAEASGHFFFNVLEDGQFLAKKIVVDDGIASSFIYLDLVNRRQSSVLGVDREYPLLPVTNEVRLEKAPSDVLLKQQLAEKIVQVFAQQHPELLKIPYDDFLRRIAEARQNPPAVQDWDDELLLVDGIRMVLTNGVWILFRKSNTSAVIVFKAEADSRDSAGEVIRTMEYLSEAIDTAMASNPSFTVDKKNFLEQIDLFQRVYSSADVPAGARLPQIRVKRVAVLDEDIHGRGFYQAGVTLEQDGKEERVVFGVPSTVSIDQVSVRVNLYLLQHTQASVTAIAGILGEDLAAEYQAVGTSVGSFARPLPAARWGDRGSATGARMAFRVEGDSRRLLTGDQRHIVSFQYRGRPVLAGDPNVTRAIRDAENAFRKKNRIPLLDAGTPVTLSRINALRAFDRSAILSGNIVTVMFGESALFGARMARARAYEVTVGKHQAAQKTQWRLKIGDQILLPMLESKLASRLNSLARRGVLPAAMRFGASVDRTSRPEKWVLTLSMNGAQKAAIARPSDNYRLVALEINKVIEEHSERSAPRRLQVTMQALMGNGWRRVRLANPGFLGIEPASVGETHVLLTADSEVSPPLKERYVQLFDLQNSTVVSLDGELSGTGDSETFTVLSKPAEPVRFASWEKAWITKQNATVLAVDSHIGGLAFIQPEAPIDFSYEFDEEGLNRDLITPLWDEAAFESGAPLADPSDRQRLSGTRSNQPIGLETVRQELPRILQRQEGFTGQVTVFHDGGKAEGTLLPSSDPDTLRVEGFEPIRIAAFRMMLAERIGARLAEQHGILPANFKFGVEGARLASVKFTVNHPRDKSIDWQKNPAAVEGRLFLYYAVTLNGRRDLTLSDVLDDLVAAENQQRGETDRVTSAHILRIHDTSRDGKLTPVLVEPGEWMNISIAIAHPIWVEWDTARGARLSAETSRRMRVLTPAGLFGRNRSAFQGLSAALSGYLVQTARANEPHLLSSEGARLSVMVDERPDAAPQVFGLRIEKQGAEETLVVTRQGAEPVRLAVDGVARTQEGLVEAKVDLSELLLQFQMLKNDIGRELAQVADLDTKQPVLMLLDPGLIEDTTFRDIALLGAWSEKKKDANTFFGFDTADPRVREALFSHIELFEESQRLPKGSLRALFSGDKTDDTVTVHVSAPKPVSRIAGHRYVFMQKPSAGEIVFIFWDLIKASGRIALSRDKELDPHFVNAYETALGKEIRPGVLKDLLEGAAELRVIIENALPKLMRVGLELFYQWAKNKLSVGRSA